MQSVRSITIAIVALTFGAFVRECRYPITTRAAAAAITSVATAI
jgi:hypothetical protein